MDYLTTIQENYSEYLLPKDKFQKKTIELRPFSKNNHYLKNTPNELLQLRIFFSTRLFIAVNILTVSLATVKFLLEKNVSLSSFFPLLFFHFSFLPFFWFLLFLCCGPAAAGQQWRPAAICNFY